MTAVLEQLTPEARVVARELFGLAMNKRIDPDVKRRALVDVLNLFEDWTKDAPQIAVTPQIQIINHMAIPGLIAEPTIAAAPDVPSINASAAPSRALVEREPATPKSRWIEAEKTPEPEEVPE